MNDYEKILDLIIKDKPLELKKLLGSGVDLNFRYDQKRTPLHWAVQEGHIEVIELLLEAGADVNAVDIEGFTPLHLAVGDNRIEIVKVLLNAGASTNADKRFYRSGSVLHWASSWGFFEIVKLLIRVKSIDLNMRDDGDRTPLHWAVQEGHIEVIKMLLEAGADVNTVDVYNFTPLFVSVGENHLEVTKMLLKAGASPNARDCDNGTVLHLACSWGYYDIVKLLVGIDGIDISPEQADGETPLFYAKDGGFTQIVDYLIEHGAHD